VNSTVAKLRARAQEQSWALRFSLFEPRDGWQSRAACRGADLAHFFVDGPVRADHPTLNLCRRCPVRMDCGADAWQFEVDLVRAQVHGIRAGFSSESRHRMMRFVESQP